MKPCIFCAIVHGDIPSHQIWENNTHLAFLGAYPAHAGMTLVIPKEHIGSDVFQASNEMTEATFLASKEVALRITEVFPGTLRVALVFEGLGVDHLHAKLYPLNSSEGFSTADGPRADDRELELIAKKLRTRNDA